MYSLSSFHRRGAVRVRRHRPCRYAHSLAQRERHPAELLRWHALHRRVDRRVWEVLTPLPKGRGWERGHGAYNLTMATPALASMSLTAEDMYHMPRDGHKYELLSGSLVVNLPGMRHEEVGANLVGHLGVFADRHDIGYVFGSNIGFELSLDTVLSPDVAFVTSERFPGWCFARRLWQICTRSRRRNHLTQRQHDDGGEQGRDLFEERHAVGMGH